MRWGILPLAALLFAIHQDPGLQERRLRLCKQRRCRDGQGPHGFL